MSIRSALHLSRVPAACFVIVGLFWGAFAAHVPDLKAQIGASDAVFGLVIFGQAAGLLTAMVLAPRLDRRLGRAGLQVAATALALAWLLPGWIVTPVGLFLVMLLLGATSGLLDVSMNARVSELEARHGRTLMNANHAMFSAGYAVAALASGLTREAGVPPAWVFGGISLLVLAIVPFLGMAPEVVEDDPAAPAGRYPAWPLLVCGAIVLVAFMSEATVEQWSALHIERTLGGGAAEGALGPAMLGLMMTLGRFSGQAVSDRFDDLWVIRVAACLSASGAIIAALAPGPAVAYLGFGVLGLGVSVIGPLGLALAGRSVHPRWRTDVIAKAAVMGFTGFFIAPIFMGGISEVAGLRVAFAAVAGILALALPLTLLASRLPAPAHRPA